jgi:Sulfotransferase family
MTMPNFLIIGAGKSGTPALVRYLEQHPEVYMSPKREPGFFALEGRELDSFAGPVDRERMRQRGVITDIEGYRALFAGVAGEQAVGEGSVIYLHAPEAAGRIRRRLPEVKLIAVLRNPVERAYASYLWKSWAGWERLGFSDALAAEEQRTRDGWVPGWQYRQAGFYHAHLTRYYELFRPDQISVYLYEDLNDDPVATTQSVLRFLEVDDAFVPKTSINPGDAASPAKSRALQTFTDKPNPLKSVIKPFLPGGLRQRLTANLRNRNRADVPPMPESIRAELTDAYREDLLKLQGLIGRDLSGWLSEEHVPA